MRLTFLGTGTSFGVPQVGCGCAVCRSGDPRDRRTRSGALLQSGDTTLLLDSPPELRLQLLGQGVTSVSAVLYTHEHADHTAGIDDLRIFTVRKKGHLPVYGPPETLDLLAATYRYIFDPGVTAFEGTSKPHLEPHPLEPGVATTVEGVPVLPLAFPHGHLRVYGYRFGKLAYLTDVKEVGAIGRAALQGVEVLVLNALWWRAHPTHLSIDEAVALSRDLGATRTYLTHLTHETGHAELAARLPPGVSPAYDGLTVEVSQ
ncbi:MAG: MBL fold metallo-hydrolase [Gemmatimonadales bacterium]|jgi:phosphoribosyl 1,2-cyclic phosphate phosphodiesterase|nr:MAG: MBL fold metallo-hydrolase [Gemmatimonadales bacterium]